jgi:hypothetical protein
MMTSKGTVVEAVGVEPGLLEGVGVGEVVGLGDDVEDEDDDGAFDKQATIKSVSEIQNTILNF